MSDKIHIKLIKLLALAERGVGGEKVNAQRMLEKLMKRHGIEMSDLAGEKIETRWFRFKGSLEKKTTTPNSGIGRGPRQLLHAKK